MRPDLLRWSGALAAALALGLIIDNIFLCLSLALVLLLIRQYRAIAVLHRLARGAADAEQLAHKLPAGVIHEIVRELESLRAHHRQREEKLSGFLSRFQQATEALPDAVIVTDAGGRIEWANRRAADYLGIAAPRDSGLLLSNLIRHPHLIEHLAAIAHASNTDNSGAIAGEPLLIDSPLHAARQLEIRISRYGASSLLLVARDVTDVLRANRMRKDFIANASHELRTPLTVISGYLEAFDSDEADCPPAWRPQLRQMRTQARRMQNLIDDLLKLSTLESEPAAGDKPVKVAELLALIHSEAQTLSGAARHILYLETDPYLTLRGDQGNLYSAFSNIIFNALQYTPGGGIIRIRWYLQDGARAVLEVTDSGEGIAAEHIGRITERFYRVDKGRSRAQGGTGLGLAIVKHVMVQHGAELAISSTPGEGATVKCIFPKGRFALQGERLSEDSFH